MKAQSDFAHFESHAATDIGRVRAENQDCCGITALPGSMLLAVCDGMGGHEGGGVASALAMNALHDRLKEGLSGKPANDLERAVLAAGRAVREAARASQRLRFMGTTCVAALVGADNVAHIANVGDSRAYLIRGGVAAQVTRDHTVYEEQQRSGVQFMAENSEALRHVLTRCLGMDATLRVDMFEVPLEAGDLLLLCSDGLMAHVPDEEFAEAFEDVDLATGAKILIDCANARGGCDNTTIAVLRWSDGEHRAPNPARAASERLQSVATTNPAAAAPAGTSGVEGSALGSGPGRTPNREPSDGRGRGARALHAVERGGDSAGLTLAGIALRAPASATLRPTLPLWFRILKPAVYTLLIAWICLLLFITFVLWS